MKFNLIVVILYSTLIVLVSCQEGNQKPEHGLVTYEDAYPDNSEYYKDNNGKLFQPISPETTGIDFSNPKIETIDDNFWKFLYSIIGGGVGASDINNDGRPDLYFSANNSPNRLYINKGNWEFEEISEKAGVDDNLGYSLGVTMVDINADGWMDIYVCRSGPHDEISRKNLLYINNGDLTFTEKAEEYGLDASDYSTQAGFFDMDLDGDLDMYLVNHPSDFKDRVKLTGYDKIEKGANQSDKLYRNDGNGSFTDISIEAGINNHGYGLSVSIGDLNNDNWPDVFVANDFAMNDYVYLNNQDGTFTESIRKVLKKTSQFAMGSDLADFNNDGWLDIIVADVDYTENWRRQSMRVGKDMTEFFTYKKSGFFYQYTRNVLQLNNGDGTFSEISLLSGVSTTNWSWSQLLGDYDNDGWKDCFVSNGFIMHMSLDDRVVNKEMKKAVRKKDEKLYLKYRDQMRTNSDLYHNFIFKNNGDLTFTNKVDEWGFEIPNISYGATHIDLDGDGDLDIVANNMNGEVTLYKNRARELHADNYLIVQLNSKSLNKNGIGSRVYIWDKEGNVQLQQASSVKGFLSSSDPGLHFGLGPLNQVLRLEVFWPDGKKQVINDIDANQTIVLQHKDAVLTDDLQPIKKEQKYFAEITSEIKLDHKHIEKEYDDFAREFLLHRQLSNIGPGIAVGDVDSDGIEDLFIGGASGKPGTLYLQKASGDFIKSDQNVFTSHKSSEDIGAAFLDFDGDDDLDLYICSGGNENRKESQEYGDRLYENDGKGIFTLTSGIIPTQTVSGSCVSVSDFDSDGDPDIFIGGRLKPVGYPETVESNLLINENGKFREAMPEIIPGFEHGMVCSALWTDFDNDRDQDLITVGDWMPIKIYKNNNGVMEDISAGSGLENTNGWWNSITGGDFDNDGDTDYILGNYGKNTRYKPTVKEPVEAYYSDFDSNGSKDFVLAFYEDGVQYPMQKVSRIREQLPSLQDRYTLFEEFGKSSMQDIFGNKAIEESFTLKACTFSNSYMQNNGDGTFTISELPVNAQISPILGMMTLDINEDGNLDVLTHGNIFGIEPNSNKQDAGTGTLLLGNGNGSFTAKMYSITGFKSDGDSRSLSFIFHNKSGKPIVLASSNNDHLKLFELMNTINSKWIKAEKDEVLAEIELMGGKVIQKEIYNGDGYLSQNSKYIQVPSNAVSVKFHTSDKSIRIVNRQDLISLSN